MSKARRHAQTPTINSQSARPTARLVPAVSTTNSDNQGPVLLWIPSSINKGTTIGIKDPTGYFNRQTAGAWTGNGTNYLWSYHPGCKKGPPGDQAGLDATTCAAAAVEWGNQMESIRYLFGQWNILQKLWFIGLTADRRELFAHYPWSIPIHR